jgi:hypothetical protein
MTPNQVLSLEVKDPELRLMILVAYFFSIRPQELFALTRDDFTAGDDAAELECCKVMVELGLFGRFAVRIERQRRLANEKARDPKVNSVGWVACFNEAGAKAIAARLKELPDGPLFKSGATWFNTRLRNAELGFTWKDLRRASLYHLGHYSKINKVQIKSHSRHRDDKSIELYLRRPDASVKRSLDL